MICLKSTSLDTLMDPLHVEDDLPFLTSILAIEALTAFTMRVNCDRSKALLERWDWWREEINGPRTYGTPL